MRSHRVLRWIAVGSLTVAACTGASDTLTSTTESAGALRVRCSVIGSELIDELQVYVDGFASYSLAELPDGQVPGLADIEIRIGQSRSDAEAEGCDMAAFATDLANSARGLQGQGPVGRPLAASLRGDPPATEAEAVTRIVGVDDDLAGVIATAGPGSLITLEPGIYQISELILIDRPMTILGPATGEAVIRSSAKDAAVMVPSDGSLVMENLSIEHVGNSSASVLVAAGGDVDLGGVVLSGGVTDETTGSDGHGLAVVSDADGQISPSTITIAASRIAHNAGVGIAIFGSSNPTIEDVVVVENGACGVCFFDNARGSISRSEISNNQVGVGSSGLSRPRIEYNNIEANSASGIVVTGSALPQINWNELRNNSNSGIEIGGDSGPTVRSNTISGSSRSVVVADDAHPFIRSNTFQKDEVAVSVSGTAAPVVESNSFAENSLASILVAENATGIFRGNDLAVSDIGIQIAGTASPLITGNTFAGEDGIGVLYVDEATGTLATNTYSGLANGIQVGDLAIVVIESETIRHVTGAAVVVTGSSMATLSDVTIDGADFGIFVDADATAVISASAVGETDSAGIVFSGSATGSVTDTSCSGGSSIVLVGGASPDISENDCSVSNQA